MKRALLPVIVLLAFVPQLKAQEPKSPTVEFLHKRGYQFPEEKKLNKTPVLTQWPDTMYYNTAYKATLLGSPTIPISFSKVEFINGEYTVTPIISIGYGYNWFFGKFYLSENDKIIVDPTFFFGVAANLGIQNDFNLKKPAGFFTGVFIGVSAFSLFAGYDFITTAPSIGIGGKIDVYTLSQNALRPFGKVVPVRRPKKSAMPVVNE